MNERLTHADIELNAETGNYRLRGNPYARPAAVSGGSPASSVCLGGVIAAPTLGRTRSGPNETELLYRRKFLSDYPDACVWFEGVRFRLPGEDGAHYTPDWALIEVSAFRPGPFALTLVECKRRFANGKRLLSYPAARRRFDAARAAWPCFRWVWAELQPSKEWIVEG